METYRNLKVYENSYQLSIIIHKISIRLPREVRDIADQIRRCSRSIPANISEGYARNKSLKDRINFLQTAMGSNGEMNTHLSCLKDLGYVKRDLAERLIESYDINGRRLNKLITFNKFQLKNETTKTQNN